MKAKANFESQRQKIMRMLSSGKIDARIAEELIAQINYKKEALKGN